jgi:7-carboxy-7-deazaguanine synthase (Cx14CxxC type)
VTYSVKEVFYTLQGEGHHSGRAAVFLRFSGCNLWSGREQDRQSAACRFCDTDFIGCDGSGGGKYRDADQLAAQVAVVWFDGLGPGGQGGRLMVVCTGGEPLLQLDAPLIAALHERGFMIAVETNGTLAAPAGIDWLCVSPKAGCPLEQRSGDELKLVWPQAGIDPVDFEDLDFTHWFLQPMDGPRQAANTQQVLDYCLAHPKWRLGLQAHKVLGIP